MIVTNFNRDFTGISAPTAGVVQRQMARYDMTLKASPDQVVILPILISALSLRPMALTPTINNSGARVNCLWVLPPMPVPQYLHRATRLDVPEDESPERSRHAHRDQFQQAGESPRQSASALQDHQACGQLYSDRPD